MMRTLIAALALLFATATHAQMPLWCQGRIATVWCEEGVTPPPLYKEPEKVAGDVVIVILTATPLIPEMYVTVHPVDPPDSTLEDCAAGVESWRKNRKAEPEIEAYCTTANKAPKPTCVKYPTLCGQLPL